ncbi:hypothetical protein KY284_036583 [Solanum tuberosum]|nr:hypothetical protein KY284_036583 [Solanum tuberosum]
MGTREVYEEKLKRGNLHHDPTIKLGLGSARCPRCLSLLNSNSKSGEWAITPILHDFTAVVSLLYYLFRMVFELQDQTSQICCYD